MLCAWTSKHDRRTDTRRSAYFEVEAHLQQCIDIVKEIVLLSTVHYVLVIPKKGTKYVQVRPQLCKRSFICHMTATDLSFQCSKIQMET